MFGVGWFRELDVKANASSFIEPTPYSTHLFQADGGDCCTDKNENGNAGLKGNHRFLPTDRSGIGAATSRLASQSAFERKRSGEQCRQNSDDQRGRDDNQGGKDDCLPIDLDIA